MGRPFSYIKQAEAGECGLACLAMIANHYGYNISLSGLRQKHPGSVRGVSLRSLIAIADKLGFNSRGVRTEMDHVGHLVLPAILHWELNHYVVLYRIERKRKGNAYLIADPAIGLRWVLGPDFSARFTGIALELLPAERFRKAEARLKLSVTQLWTRSQYLWPTIGTVFVLSLIIQTFALLAPLQMQLCVDYVVSSTDADLALVLLLGFLGIWALNAIATFLRANLILRINTALSLHTALNLFRHTLSLPVHFFERRHVGDIVSRFSSLQPVNDMISKGLVAAAIDGLLSIVTLIVMIIYSPLMATVSVIAVGIYGISRFLSQNAMRLANVDLLSAQAQESSTFMESIRGISTIKTFCQEHSRRRIWQNKKTMFINSTFLLGRISASFETVSTAIISLENVLFVFISIKMVLDGTLSLGMVFAFQLYKQNFVGALIRLLDQTAAYRLADVHLDRIADIAYALPEQETDEPQYRRSDDFMTISLSDLRFRYDEDSPYIIEKLDLTVNRGETIAIIGPSGAGKTTLVKIITCLLKPEAGRIAVNDVPIELYGVRRYRSMLGVVSQEDTLFSGSIAENISFFEPEIDYEWLDACCKKTAIFDDIQRMPMGYETLVGDMGSSLSGGQKQRVLLARALYKKPTVLIMDEGTAHLDTQTEQVIARSLKEMGLARITVAHRSETIALADRVLLLAQHRLRDVTASRQQVAGTVAARSEIERA